MNFQEVPSGISQYVLVLVTESCFQQGALTSDCQQSPSQSSARHSCANTQQACGRHHMHMFVRNNLHFQKGPQCACAIAACVPATHALPELARLLALELLIVWRVTGSL